MIAGSPVGVVAGALTAGLVYAAIVHSKERYLAREFGVAYRAYCRGVPRWLSRPLGLAQTLRAYRFDWAAVVIREYNTLYTTALITLTLLVWKTAHSGALGLYLAGYAASLVILSLAYALARYLKKTRRLQALR